MTAQAVHTLGFWRSYATTARPYLSFVSATAGLVGLALAPELSWGALAAAAVAFFFAYGFGQALTDTTQVDTDAISAPYRPLCRGLVTARQVAAVSLFGLVACAAALTSLNPWVLAPATAGVAGLATYTWFKRRWWAGPFYNAWIVALLPIMGFLCGAPTFAEAWACTELWAAATSVFFSYAVFVVLGYLKDISADRATGYVTVAVRFGWRAAVALSAVFAVTAVLASSTFMLTSAPGGAQALSGAHAIWLAGLAALVAAHVLCMRAGSEREAHLGIGFSVRAFVLIHLGEAAAAMPALMGVALVSYPLFELGLALRPERSQI